MFSDKLSLWKSSRPLLSMEYQDILLKGASKHVLTSENIFIFSTNFEISFGISIKILVKQF